MFASVAITGINNYIKVGDLTFDFQGITSARGFLANNSGWTFSDSIPRPSVTLNNVNLSCDLTNFLRSNDFVEYLTINGTGGIDVRGLLEYSRARNVTINCDITQVNNRFGQYSKVETVSDISISLPYIASSVFSNMAELYQVGNVYAPDSELAAGMFHFCDKLTEVGLITAKRFNTSVFSGSATIQVRKLTGVVTEDGNINISNQPYLTDESVQSILEHLSNRTGSSFLYLNASIKKRLTDEQIAIATEKG